MFSARNPDDVLSDLPDQLFEAHAEAVSRAAEDWHNHKLANPRDASEMFQRTSAGMIHTFLRKHLGYLLDGVGNVSIHSKDPLFVITAAGAGGHLYRIRVKRHGAGDEIASYPTRLDREFWGDEPSTLFGPGDIRLAFGYRWDREIHEVGAPVVSYREGKANVIWAVQIERAAAAPIRFTPIAPSLPEIDLLDAARGEHRFGEAP
jgi:hypothetical protein